LQAARDVVQITTADGDEEDYDEDGDEDEEDTGNM
jgi:hypothetical protein